MDKSTILVVDDEAINLKLVAQSLSGRYEVSVVRSGAEALDLLQNHHVDLILLDIGMPHMNGFEVAKKLKETILTAEIPVIFLTADNRQETIVKAFESGAVDYIIKPFGIEELNARVDNHIRINHLQHLLEASEKQYKAITEQNIACVYVIQDGMLSYVNDAFVKLMGYDSADEIIKKIPISNFIAVDEQPKVNENIRKLQGREMQSAHYETVFLRKDGRQTVCEVHGAAGEYDEMPAIIGVLIDKTEQRKAEEFRNLLLSSLGDGVFGVDTEGKCTFINDAALQMLGFRLEEVLGAKPHSLFHHHDRDKQACSEDKYPVCKTIVDGRTRDVEDFFIRKNGEYFDIHLRVAPIVSGQTVGAVVVFQDVTERKILEENLRSITNNLYVLVKEETDKRVENEKLLMQQSKMAAMGEMISMIAHQWRQPITAIGMTANNLKADIALGSVDLKNFEENLNDINSFVLHLSKTIDDFRDFFKEEKEKELVSIDHIITNAVHIIDKSLQDSNIELHIELGASMEVMLFRREIMQVFLDIIKNAKDIMRERDIKQGHINIKSEQKEQEIAIYIWDNAGGIPEDVLPRIFEPYFTTRGPTSGTGLGLYMSDTIVKEHHGGRIEAKNIENGACFTISLPMRGNS